MVFLLKELVFLVILASAVSLPWTGPLVEFADDPDNQEQPSQVVEALKESPNKAEFLDDPDNQEQPSRVVESKDEPVSALKSRDHRKRSKRNAIPKQYLWEKKNNAVTISYTTSSLSSTTKQELERVIDFFRRHTCINLVKLSDDKPEGDYIEFNGGMTGCSSEKGRKGGKQITYLGSGCYYRGHIMHEIMHSLGFLHEQNRSDRDNFITINWNNIAEGFADQFNKENGNNQGYTYDFHSVMHYQADTFNSAPSSKTMVPKDTNKHIGDMTIMDAWDIEKINKLYGCPQAATKYKNHIVTLETSDSFLAGTDLTPWIRLIGTNGKKTQFEEVSSGGRIANENERGAVESHLVPFEDIGQIEKLELRLLAKGQTPYGKRSIPQPLKKRGWFDFDGWTFQVLFDGVNFGGGDLDEDETVELKKP